MQMLGALETLMQGAYPLRAARKQFVLDVQHAYRRVPVEIAASAVGHAVLAEALIQLAADILNSQENSGFLNELLHASVRREQGCSS